LFLCFHHDCTKAIRVVVCGCGCGCRLAYFLADRVHFLAQAVHTAGVACTKQYASPAANSQLVLGLLQGPVTDTCFHREGFAGFPDFALLAPVVGPMVILFPPFSFCLGLGPPVKSEYGITSHVQTEEAGDGSPFFSFPSLWHPLPSWHKFAPNWHKIVWQNAASHMVECQKTAMILDYP
jgi:hypothetical protein